MNASRFRHNPWTLLDQLYKNLDQNYSHYPAEADEETTVATSAWVPAVDIKEEEDRFVIQADIPGVAPSDIEVTMEKGMLTIRGERSIHTAEERKLYKRVERTRGTFYRRFGLPDTADADRISASGKHGVLEIIIPKRQAAQTRKIDVRS
jgi:HSP20 family protein